MQKKIAIAAFATWGMFVAPAMAAGVLLEAEANSATGGGSFTMATDRAATSGGKALIGWDADGQWIEWAFEAPEAGDYQITLRYASGRGWDIWRELKLDGQVPGEAFAKLTLKTTGGWGRAASEWQNLTLAGANSQPLTLKLTAGKHVLRLTSLGGDGANGSANLDALVLSSKGTDPQTLFKP
ncbi:MAG: hypothetical protein CGU29_01735 [Candidatus Dactylopiibacterium carminicum]|uniref:CBM6 domain-containing protein n=1 Tax=Candidatus Dactylopiibacterium carminicum TaxID=857335 RepID=A0A272EZY8_9RHOO|nr:carbohydrate-binding protein [Candidatus Dactylopiibacterium carminicum]KAF7600574.1 hypothetical protein BGI27_01435 [Candidatus Dactylopiibacterium carminicum]PAS95190.1 MAG: hypothetical protein CGU29_01735 [Candidatus Dactylopiibacterium carminicum]PAT00579.1 MAG: hypothetical protein BSR46_01450 [Candidatus Dactylopiibacterium carminicum]